MGRRNVLRAVVGLAAVDATIFGVMTRADADGMPRVYTRGEWGAAPPRRAPRLLRRPPDHIIVHHTASPNTDDMSKAHAFALSRQIQRFHMGGRHWDDIGEQLTISRGGYVMEGRAGTLDAIRHGGLVVGAQSLHHNDHTIGIENEGTYSSEDVPVRLWRALVGVCTWLCQAYELDPALAIIGHRDYNHTECPGDVLYGRLPRLRREVARALGDDAGQGDDSSPDAAPDQRRSLTARHRRAAGHRHGHGSGGHGSSGHGKADRRDRDRD